MKYCLVFVSALAFLSLTSFKKAEMPMANKSSWHLLYLHWDTWGHKSAGCDGGGLCNIRGCAFCEVDAMVAPHSGPVNWNDETGTGTLTIALDASDPVQNKFIQRSETFYVDEDLYFKDGHVVAGEYPFNPSVGESGGYLIPVVID